MKKDPVQQMLKEIFGEMVIEYPFNGPMIRKYREKLGVSVREFAYLCGWSLRRQRQIEQPRKEQRMMFVEHRDKIVAVFYILQSAKEVTDFCSVVLNR